MVTLLDGDIPAEWYDAAIAARIVGVDIETSGLDKNKDRIATIQMYVPSKGTIMIRNFSNYHSGDPTFMLSLLESREVIKIFHHAPFDLAFLIRDYGIWPECIADTKVAAKILDPKREQFRDPLTGKGSHKLMSLIHYYYGEILDKSLAVSDWFAKELDAAQIEYAEKDVKYLPDLLRRLELELTQKGLIELARKAYMHIPTHVLLEVKKYEDVYGY